MPCAWLPLAKIDAASLSNDVSRIDFPRAIAVAEPAESVRAHSCASASKVSGELVRSAIPSDKASSASILRPVKMSSLARARPTLRGRKVHAAAVGNEAPQNIGPGETGQRACNHEVASHSGIRAQSRRSAVHCCDRRLRHGMKKCHGMVDALLSRPPIERDLARGGVHASLHASRYLRPRRIPCRRP